MAVPPSFATAMPLPFLPLAQGDVDYQVDCRADPRLIPDALADPSTSVVAVCAGKLAVPRGQASRLVMRSARVRLATIPGPYARTWLGEERNVVWMYLGSYPHGGSLASVVAVDIGSSDAGREGDAGPEAILERMRMRFDWASLRDVAPHASARDAGLATTASSLSVWHSRQSFCPMCGATVVAALSGWGQRCRGDDHHLLFPRVEPAVITSVVDGDDRLLLQHNAEWDDDRLYSVSAGFVESGENLEHAARREAREETGVGLGEVRYLGSQPWPYPASLMVAFTARARSIDIHVDDRETVDARWMSREEYSDALTSETMVAPGRATIARYMIEQWYGRELD